MFYPTHRHADGGVYQYLGPQKGKLSVDDIVAPEQTEWSKWTDGVAYRSESGMMFWTSQSRWVERFEEIAEGHTGVIEWAGDESVVAAFQFSVTDASDVRYMLITAGPQPSSNLSRDQRDWMKRVLQSQAEAVTAGLHVRAHDFPDLIGDVAAFHAKFGQEYTGKPRLLPDDLFDFRHKFHMEETMEYHDEQPKLKAAVVAKDRRDILHSLEIQLDSLADAVWVLLGTADLQFGRHAFYEAWRRVVVANMAKVLATDDPTAQDSGREIKYDIRKPKGWLPPDHGDLIADNAIFDSWEEPEPDGIETQGFNQEV